MIDLHCHLLAGIDDGPETLEESVQMAKMAVADGIGTVAATPHLRSDHPLSRPDELAGRLAVLIDRLEAESLPLRVVAGGEVDVFWAQRASDIELRLVSYDQGGHDLLLETPYGFLPEVFEELIAEVVGRGYRVTLAHPERNESLQRSPERLEALVDDGVIIQVNAASVTPSFPDNSARRLALRLLRAGRVHMLASDAHSAGQWRPPEIAQGREVARRQGDSYADWLVRDVPAAVLQGAPLPPRPRMREQSFLERSCEKNG